MTHRPTDLPDFGTPPLKEVAMGVQFETPEGYQQIRAYEVWGLYRDQFPIVEERQAIPPTFETFGLPQRGPRVEFGVVSGALHDRFLFLSQEKDQLIQFQSDRLLHNWRKDANRGNEYPRFEILVGKFEAEFALLDQYMKTLSGKNLSVNQCEITYTNHIILGESQIYPSKWFRILGDDKFNIENISLAFTKLICGPDGSPMGRLICEVNSALDGSGTPLLVAQLSARGAPRSTSIADALDFICIGRNLIVKMFAEITSEAAHTVWERTQ
ncbi:MAG: TIGR04255 family protein [Alphaproteobacteria bacterium]|nr:TIGR04255 family protein [Alphaproteobacteria bacterium]